MTAPISPDVVTPSRSLLDLLRAITFVLIMPTLAVFRLTTRFGVIHPEFSKIFCTSVTIEQVTSTGPACAMLHLFLTIKLQRS